MKTLQLTARGLSGPAWIKRLKKNRYKLGTYAEQLLNSPDFERHRMKKGEKVTVAIISNKDTGTGDYFTTAQIRDYAKKLGYETPKAEIACLIRESISDDDMKELDVWYAAVLHEPILDSDGGPGLLDARRGGGGQWLRTCWGRPGFQWRVEGASAFVVPASKLSELESSAQHYESLNFVDLTKRVETLEAWREGVLKALSK